MPADITKYGISGLKGLKGVNANVDPEYQEALQYRNRTLRGSSGPTLRDTFSTFSYDEGSPMSSWGTSGYDNEITNVPLTPEQVQDTRYENQPWYDTLANGVGKMLGTAATTFASSLLGLPYGLVRTGAAAVSGEENPWANLWDNEITQGLSEVEDWMEKNMTNYKSTEQQSAPWYSLTNLGSMNFWADDVIKNAGFTLGAAASMAVGSGALGLLSKSMGIVNKASTGTKIANGFLSALFSATGEGMIEAKNGVDERNKLEIQRLNDMLAPERQALEMELNEIQQDYAITGDYEAYKRRLDDYTLRKDYLDQREAAGMEEIERSGKDMGNKILMGNQALLTAGNLIQFGKLMTKSFNNARHAAEVSSKSARPSMWRDGFTATRNSADDITKGYSMSSKNLGRLRAGTKGLLTEGSEEMNQQWIQSGAGAAYNERDVNDYWKAKLDPEAYRDTTEGLYTLGSALSQGFNESWGDVNQWEQFVIGGLTGMAGSYSPTKLFNQDKTKSRWDPRRYGSWEGGAYNEIRDFNDQYNQYAENIDDLNKILDQENFGARVQNLIAHSFLERRKEQAALENDMKTWKDEDDKQAVHDIQAFYRAGKIDDLRALYNEMSQNMSDADIESIIKRTTREIPAEEDKENYYAALDEEIGKKQQNVNDLYNQLENVQADYESGNIAEAEAQSKTKDLRSKISNAEAEVNKLTEERNLKDKAGGYSGSPKYEGPYVDINGNQIKSNDEIREEIKHNSEELNRKLDSYLDSVEQVNRDTRGRVSKDQEDNLAYLHFMGRESQNRFLKTISKRRADMPQTFLLKTDKTPEKLTEEYGTSDLVFNKNDRTPDGYVEANTSMMTDNDFANFFMREVMWGGNISTEFGETADEKAQREKDEKDTSLSAEEKKKRAMDRFTAKMKAEDERREKEQQEQQSTNVKRMKEDFVRNYRKNNNATVDEALKEWDNLKQDVIDASNLLNQAGEYRRTLQEYLMNPQKVDQDKAKEEKKAEKQAKKNEVKGMSVRDLSNRDDLNELFSEAQKENDITLMNKIKKAQVLREKKANLDAADGESNLNGADVSDEENAALEILRQQVENDIDDDSTIDDKKAQTAKELTDLVADVDEGLIDSYVDEHAVVNIDPKTGAKTLSLKRGALSPEEKSQQAQFEAENPEEYDRQKTILIDRIHNSVRSIDDRMNEVLSKIDDTDIVSEDVAKLQKYTDQVKEDENLPDIEPEKKNDRNTPVQTVPNTPETPIERRPIDGIGEEAALASDMQQGTENGLQTSSNSGQHPWQIISGRVGYHTNEPYSNTLRRLVADPNVSEENKKIYRKQLKRAEAVEKFLSNEESGAYTRVENGGAQRRSTVKFKVFRKVNEAAEDFVIFICSVNDKGEIIGVLGDLPSSDPDIDPNTEKRTGLAALYEEARKQLDENADATELELKGIESEIDFEYIGKPQYRKEGEPRKTVNELFNNGEFTLALKVSDNNEDNPVVKVDTGKKSFKGKLEMDAIKDPLTGNVGQPYILIPTSQAARKNNTGRGYWAVPIATPTFGEIDRSSVFYRTVKQTLESIRDGKLSETEAKTRLGELFGVANFHVNFTEGESRKAPGIRTTTYIRQDGSEKGAPHTLYVGDRASMDVETVLNELGRFFINISNSKINSKETYTTVDGTSYTYNQMIGEIATTDAARPHTVNDWFTIRPVEKKGNKWVKSETPTQRIPYPSGSEKAVFHVTIPYQDGTKHVWTISPRDWTVRDEQGRPILYNDGTHSNEEADVAAIHMARAFGRYYMKDMSKPYVVLVGEQSRLFDPTNNTFKAAQELEEAPKYKKGQSFSSAEAEYDFLTTIEQARAEKAAGGGTSNVEITAQQIGQDMATHLKEMGVDVELVDSANKAAEGIEDAQLSVEELNEMEQIKAKAQANGTFMKAPNGKPTNLTERQWLQVRTKAFKKWFGDWEKFAPKLQVSDDKKLQDILQNIADSDSRFSTLAKFILDNHLSPIDLGELHIDREYPLKHQRGWYKEIDDPWVGIIRYIGFEANNVPEETFNAVILHETIHSLTQRLLKNYKSDPNSVPENIRVAINNLYEIIDYSKKYILSNYNIENESDKEKLFNLAKRQNFDKGYMHRMFYAFDEASNPESEHIDEFISEIFTNPAFQEMLNSIPYKETKKTLWDKIKECIQNIFGIPINRGSVLEEALKASAEFITKAKKEYDSVSKVVDENGEPLVVYHHTDNPNLTRFSTDFENYFAKDGGTKEAIFFDEEKTGTLNRKYDLPVFLNIRELNEYNETKQQLHDRGTTYREIVNNSAKKNNKTGGVHMKDFDDNKKEHQSIWIIHNPNQVKSATDNNGEFSTENPDINMLKVDGKILGFEHNGKLYLQKDALNPNLPMHEYTHLWDKVIKRVDPRLWNRGKELMKTEAADLWKQIAEDENYGKRWEKEGKTAEELEDLIASEVHARLTGKGFEEYASKKKGTFAQLKQWVLDACKTIAKTLGMSDAEVEKLTLADWNNMTVRDFMEKSITMNTIQDEAQKAINRERTEATIKKIKEDSADFVLADGNGNEDPNGDYYKNKKTGELHARVTSVKEGDTRVLPFKETDEQGNRNPWITPSTTIGNAVDEFVRLFFEGQDPESSVLTQNLSDKTKQHLREELEKIQKSLGTKWKVAASGIKAVGNITVKDANGDDMVIRVAGTLDLLLYNPDKNEYAIYDMKTHKGGVEDKKLGWAAQLSLYKQLLEARYPEMRGKIKGLKIVPFTTSGYDANKQSYDTDDSGRLTSNGEIVKAEVKYDGSTIDMTKDEMNLNISFARPGFKKEYVSGVGARKIIVSKPQPKLEEAPKERVKEGFVKSINKIANNDSVKTFLKPKFKDNKEAITLAEKLDKARKDGNLGELCLTLGEMNLLQDMLNTRMIDRVAARSEMINRGLDVPAAETPEADVAEGSQDIDAIAEEKGILSTATRKAWNKLTDENKEKIVQLRRGVKDVKRELKECQRLGKDPNSAIAGYLHRKADETSGYTIIDMKKELAWLDKVLPKLSKESRIRIIEGLIKCSDGTFDYGQIKQGLVYIATNGKEGTVYHEAFHAVTQWILTDNELDRLYKAAKERYGNLDTVVLEEKLADDFMRYTMGFEPSYKKHDLNIFQKLWQAIKNMFKHTSMIDKLYRDINDGIYADSVLRTNNNEFAHITEEDRQVSMKYQFLDKEQQQRLKDEKISQEQYEVLDADEKRYLFHCVI